MKKLAIIICGTAIAAILCALVIINYNAVRVGSAETALPPPSVYSASPVPTATPAPSALNAYEGDTVTVDETLIKAPWERGFFAGITDCVFYYTNADSPEDYILLQRSDIDTGADLERQLKISLKKYTDALAGTDVALSEPEYGQVNGLPTVSFETSQTVNGAAIKSKTVLIAAPGSLYCLQLQAGEENYEKSAGMFDVVAESVKSNRK